MNRALTGLDRSDLDFVWMRGLGWGAASGLMVPFTFIVITFVLWDASVLMIGLFTGIVAFLTGVFGGGIVASLGWKALRRGVRPVGVTLIQWRVHALRR